MFQKVWTCLEFMEGHITCSFRQDGYTIKLNGPWLRMGSTISQKFVKST